MFGWYVGFKGKLGVSEKIKIDSDSKVCYVC